MLSSRLVGHKWCVRPMLLLGSRQDHSDAHQPAIQESKRPAVQLENPNLLQKIICRFNGVPLKGELAPPKALLDDIGKRLVLDPLPPVPKDFKEFPERDLVNFPYPEQPMYARKTRFVIIPDHWLKEIEKVTGTSGPYALIFTSLAFLVNKEFLPYDVNVYFLLFAFIPQYFIARHIFGFRLEKYAHGLYKEEIKEKKDHIESELREANEFRKTSKEQSESLKAVQENFPTIFRENLALQLEATYRKNVDYAYSELKRRLDYMKEVQETKDRIGKGLLLKTITEGVRKKIETNEGGIRDKYMDQCIEQLRTLAK